MNPAACIVMASLAFGGALAPGPARAASGCPTTPAKLVDTPQPALAADAKPTAKTIVLEADIASDGHLRGLQLVQSSGDRTVDLAFRQALQTAMYRPAETNCVAYSGGLTIRYDLTSDETSPPANAPALRADCTPYVTAFLTPLARDRKRTGTAVVAVPLDAAGTRTGEPAVRKGTGSPVLDTEALRLARSAQYNFLLGSACTPQAFTYLLELTFE